MPDQIIEIPNVGRIAFPASMTPDQINAAAGKLYAEKNPNHPPPDPKHSWVDTAVEWLPTAGGTVGGIVGGIGGTALGVGVGGVPGAVGGAALGGAAGEAAKQLINRARGSTAPSTPGEAATAIGGQAALQGAAEAGGQAIGAGMKVAGPWLMQKALKPTMTVLKEYGTTAPKLVQTLLESGVSVTQGGVDKLQKLFDATNQEIAEALGKRDDILTRSGDNAVVDKTRVAARTLQTAGKLAEKTNPTADLRALGDTVEEFLNHPTQPGNLTLPEAQKMKIGTYQQIGKKYGEQSFAAVETQKALARGLKEEIAAEVPSISTLNQKDSELMAALDAVGRRVAQTGNKDPVGFTWVAQHPTTFLAAIMDRSPAVKSMLARGLYSSAGAAARVSPLAIRVAVTSLSSGAPDAGLALVSDDSSSNPGNR